MKNPYQLPLGYLPNPFIPLYINTDYEISKERHIEDIYDQAYALAETIPGDIDLTYLSFQYRYNAISFIINGCIAFKIKLTGAYKDTDLTFKAFCKDRLGRSYSTVRREIIASRVCLDLITMGFSILPSCVTQAELLGELHGPELYEVWTEIVETYREDQITTKTIKAVLNKDEPIEEDPVEIPVKLPRKLYHKILGLAIDLEQSIVDTITTLFEEGRAYLYDNFKTKVPSVDPMAICLWQYDLQLLILEHDLLSRQRDLNDLGENVA